MLLASKFNIQVFMLYLLIICCAGGRGGGGGGGIDWARINRGILERQAAIDQANRAHQIRLEQERAALEQARQQALAEARRAAEQAEQIRLEQERERAEKIADQQALEASQTRSLDVLNTNKRQAEVKIRQEENEALAYENVHREANQKEQMESREEYEKWTRSNLDQEKSALDETIRLVIELGRKWTEKS